MYLILYSDTFDDEKEAKASKSFSVTCVTFKLHHSIVIGLAINSLLPGWGILYAVHF